jgi:hypothetical protein
MLQQNPRQTSLELVIYKIERRACEFKRFDRAWLNSDKGRRTVLMDFSRGEGMRLDLEKIAESPGPYTMSYGFHLDGLRESIQKVGLVNPPLVARNQGGSFDIVSGYRRILALNALGQSNAFCLDVTLGLPTPLERFLAAFYEILATRKFNDIEKAIILSKLRDYATKEEILTSFMPCLSLPSHEGTLKFYLRLLDLEPNVQKAIAHEEVPIKVAKALVEMEKNSRQAVFSWFEILNFNINQQIKFIEYTQDISISDNTTISDILSSASFLQIADTAPLNTPQKAKAVLETLRVRRFPRLAQAQEAVATAISEISMPPESSIHYDPYLEDPNYRLEIRFKHGKDLKKAITKLHALHELEAIPELWIGYES